MKVRVKRASRLKRRKLRHLLLELGISNRSAGYRYLYSATLLYADNKSQFFTKELYPSVAKKAGTTASSVERCIRYTIQTAWNGNRRKNWAKYFPGFTSRPTSSTFIATIAEYL